MNRLKWGVKLDAKRGTGDVQVYSIHLRSLICDVKGKAFWSGELPENVNPNKTFSIRFYFRKLLLIHTWAIAALSCCRCRKTRRTYRMLIKLLNRFLLFIVSLANEFVERILLLSLSSFDRCDCNSANSTLKNPSIIIQCRLLLHSVRKCIRNWMGKCVRWHNLSIRWKEIRFYKVPWWVVPPIT